MSTYVIGDVQGCLHPLCRLLETIDFNPQHDTLWFTGDLANRGPEPLETLRFIKNSAPSTICVLGNHDLALLAAIEGIIELPQDDTASVIVTAPDKKLLGDWLRHLPLLHHDASLNTVMTHAGIYPYWTLEEAKSYAHEVEHILQSEDYRELLKTMYGNTPSTWSPSLSGWDRMRFILNVFTRMRFVSADQMLDFHAKGAPQDTPSLIPWFNAPGRHGLHENLVFGHWAALQGKCDTPNLYALDEGCVWGGALSALCLETKQRFKVGC